MFTVVNSKISLLQLVHMQRQPLSQSDRLPPPPRRVLAVTDDGGVRLISARTGKTLTILFPMFTGPVSSTARSVTIVFNVSLSVAARCCVQPH